MSRSCSDPVDGLSAPWLYELWFYWLQSNEDERKQHYLHRRSGRVHQDSWSCVTLVCVWVLFQLTDWAETQRSWPIWLWGTRCCRPDSSCRPGRDAATGARPWSHDHEADTHTQAHTMNTDGGECIRGSYLKCVCVCVCGHWPANTSPWQQPCRPRHINWLAFTVQ